MTCDPKSHADTDLSRRALVLASALIPIPALLGCRTVPTSATRDGLDEQLGRLAGEYRDLARRERDLPGVRSLAQIEDVALTELGHSDRTLLAAALYLEARERVGRVNRPIGRADVSGALARPLDTSRYDRAFLDRTLAGAKARAETDPGYRARLQQQQGPLDNICMGLPRWLCIMILDILIILIDILIVILDTIIVLL